MMKSLLTENMQNNTRKTLKIYWEHAKKYKFLGIIATFSIIGGSLINVILPLYYKEFFDALSLAKPKNEILEILISILISILFLHSIGWVCYRAATISSTYFQSKIIANLSDLCFEELHKHSFSYFNNNFTGSLVKRVNYFVRSFEDMIDKITWEFLPLIIKIAAIAFVLLWKNIFLGAAVIIWVIVFLILNWIFTNYKLKYDIKRSEAQTEASGFLADTITNNANVKLFCGYEKETKLFFNLNEKIKKLRIFTWNLDNFFEAFQTLLMITLEIGVFYFGIKLWEQDKFTVGDFVLLQAYVLVIAHSVWNFGRMIRQTYQNLADAEEMTIILNTPFEIQDVPRAKKIKIEKGKIEFRNVDFYYHKTRKVLDKFNLEIASSERLALIGPSGAGKTTVIKLLLRNYEVASGKILIDGQNISKVTQESLWSNISLVPQDPILFHRSLMENIRYGKSIATDEEIMEASKLAHCHEFISDLPEKYNTYVGERGIKLSGGERQRVAIARAILRNAPILILDEATSSLDSHSESLIQDALDKLMKNKTVIVIAHRLSTIVKMDRIIFIDEGKIKEEGTHKTLLAKKDGQYKKLWLLQAGGFIAD